MEIVTTNYRDNPKRVEEYFSLVRKVYNEEPDGHNFSIPEVPASNNYVLAIKDGKIVGGLTLEVFDRTFASTPHFLRRSVFNTLKRKLPHLDEEKTKLAEINHIAVDPIYQKNGIGTKVLSEGLNQSAKLGVELSLIMTNNDTTTHLAQKAAEQSNFFSSVAGSADFITPNWDRLRNTKSIVAIAHTPEMAERLRSHDDGAVLWRPRSSKTVFASPYAKGGGINGMLFDWDGTMTDEIPHWASAISHTLRDLKKEGHAIPENVWLTHSQHPKEYLKKILGEELAEKAYPKLMQHYHDLMPKVLNLLPQARETLKLLKDNNIPFAIVSNAQDPAVTNQVRHLLSEFGDVPVYANAQKPGTEVLLKAANALGLNGSSKLYYVGDSGGSDVTGALNAGLRPILFSYGDMDVATTLSNQERSGNIGLVRNHEDLQKFIAAQINYQHSADRIAR